MLEVLPSIYGLVVGAVAGGSSAPAAQMMGAEKAEPDGGDGAAGAGED